MEACPAGPAEHREKRPSFGLQGAAPVEDETSVIMFHGQPVLKLQASGEITRMEGAREPSEAGQGLS